MKYKIKEAIEILSSTPKTLNALLGNLSDKWTLVANDSETWCAFDVLGHFIHGEETDWIPRAKIILTQGENVKFVPFDRFAQYEVSKGKTFNQMLEKLRNKNIQTLRELNITEEQLQLKGMNPELGEVTLEQLLSTWVVHDLTHIRQIVVELAKKYADNVGVWKEYLTILQ